MECINTGMAGRIIFLAFPGKGFSGFPEMTLYPERVGTHPARNGRIDTTPGSRCVPLAAEETFRQKETGMPYITAFR